MTVLMYILVYVVAWLAGYCTALLLFVKALPVKETKVKVEDLYPKK